MQCDGRAVWTRQLLCGGGITAIRQWQIRPQECCGDVALYGGEKTAVTYKCQKRFLRRLGTYKCQSELVADQKLNKITSEFQTQKLAKKQSKVNLLESKTEQIFMDVVVVVLMDAMVMWW